jgi:hypothetical protein
VGDSSGEMRVRQGVDVEEYSRIALGEATAADRGESEAKTGPLEIIEGLELPRSGQS